MPEIWVPPGNTSPNQKGAGAVANCVSTKPTSRHADTGVEASFVPGRQRHMDAVGTRTAAWTCVTNANTRATNQIGIGVGFIAENNVRYRFTPADMGLRCRIVAQLLAAVEKNPS